MDRFSKPGFWKGYCSSASGHVMQTGYFPSDAVVILDQRSKKSSVHSLVYFSRTINISMKILWHAKSHRNVNLCIVSQTPGGEQLDVVETVEHRPNA